MNIALLKHVKSLIKYEQCKMKEREVLTVTCKHFTYFFFVLHKIETVSLHAYCFSSSRSSPKVTDVLSILITGHYWVVC